MSNAELFADLAITEDEEALPKRVVAGREAIPNPFVDVVKASYEDWKANPSTAKSRAFTVPVDKKGITTRAQVRKNKDGSVADVTVWEQHPNVTTALYLLRQAAGKNDLGVRIVVDYKDKSVNGVAIPVKDKDGKPTKDKDGNTITETYDDVTRKTFDIKEGRVRIRFLGQTKKETKKDDDASESTSNENVSTESAA